MDNFTAGKLQSNFHEFERHFMPKEDIEKIKDFGEDYEKIYKYLAEKYLLWKNRSAVS